MATRLLRHPLERWVDPAAAFAALFSAATDVAWLDSDDGTERGRSYLGAGSRTIVSGSGSVLERLRVELANTAVVGDIDGFALGWVGWIGYETRFETMDAPPTRRSPYPDAAFLYLDRAVEFDHAAHRVSLLGLGDDWAGELGAWRDEVIGLLDPVPPRRARPDPPPSARAIWRDTDDRYLEMIRECKAAIAAGDAYQLCLTTQASVAVTPDPFETYLALRE